MYRRTDTIDLSPENPESRTKMKGINTRRKKWIQPANYTWPRRSPPGDGDITVRLFEPGHLEEDYPITTFFLKAIDSQVLFVFANGPNNIQGSTIQPLKTLKPFERTSPPRKESSNLWMLLFRLKKKNSESCFRKTLWLDNLLLRAPRVRRSRTVAPHSNALSQSAFYFEIL